MYCKFFYILKYRKNFVSNFEKLRFNRNNIAYIYLNKLK